MPWRGELGLYLAFLQRMEEPTAVGISPSVTRADILRTIRWVAGFGAYRRLVYHQDGYLWHMYQAYVAQGMLGRHPFCHCSGEPVHTNAALPHGHPHRQVLALIEQSAPADRPALRRRYLGSDHYCSHPAWPWATEARTFFLAFLTEAVPAMDDSQLSVGDRSRLLDWCSQAHYTLEACPIPRDLLPSPIAVLFDGLERPDTGRRDAWHGVLEDAAPFHYLARSDQSNLYTMDMTLLFGHWILVGPAGP